MRGVSLSSPPHFQAFGELRGTKHAQAAMRSPLVVLLHPAGDDDAHLEDAIGLFAIKQLIAHGAVEALDVGILLGVALLDEGRLDPIFGEPIQQRGGDEFPPVVGAEII